MLLCAGLIFNLNHINQLEPFVKSMSRVGTTPRVFIVVSVSPFRGGGMWVKVADGGGAALVDGGDSQVKGKGGFAAPAFFRDDCKSIHVYTWLNLGIGEKGGEK
jgi:hypothetical protein